MFKLVLISLIFVTQIMAFSFFDNTEENDKNHLEVIHSIKDAIITTQKTRGLTNNYMNGNVVAQLLVFYQRETMMKNFKVVNKRFQKTQISQENYAQASKIMHKSKTLNKHAFKMSSALVFASYTKLIESWLDLNAVIIDEYYHTRPKAMYDSVRMLNNTLLPLSENIGKLRGMGSGIVARKYCEISEIEQMLGFADEIVRFENIIQTYMKEHSYAALSQSELDHIDTKILAYVALTRNRVIGQKNIDLNTNAYFDEGTACISEVLKIYNVIAADLQK